MSNTMLSVLIPARGCKYLTNTVEDLISKAEEEIEIIVVSDGEWPTPELKPHDNLTLIHTGTVKGMQGNINTAARVARGKYIMKCDDHCMFDKGFDKKLKASCESNWLVVPARYSLNAERWERTRGPVHYLMLTFPYNNDPTYGTGFHGKKWKGPKGDNGSFWYLEKKLKAKKIDDIIIFQGSCWFMHRDLFFAIDGLDDENYYFTQEAQQLSFKVWLSGGRVIRNKNTWYAHWHKTKPSRFGLSKRRIVETEVYSTDYWLYNRWPKRTRNFEWLIEKFGLMDGWPEDWQSPDHAKNFVHPHNRFLLKREK